MITREEIFGIVDGMPNAKRDQPFEGEFDAFVLRHADSGKWFGIVMKAPKRYFYGDGAEGYTDCLTVKCDPLLRELLQNNYDGLYPAWHMNKTHWASIPLGGSFPRAETEKLIYHSFDLTGAKPRREKK